MEFLILLILVGIAGGYLYYNFKGKVDSMQSDAPYKIEAPQTETQITDAVTQPSPASEPRKATAPKTSTAKKPSSRKTAVKKSLAKKPTTKVS